MKQRIDDEFWLLKKPIAHRGLHGDGVPENSVVAFKKALERGYPIETDVQLTSDGVAVIFHDDSTSRMTGVDADIRDISYAEVKRLKLADTQEGIMTFDELLAFVDGRVPLVIEYKTQKGSDKKKEVVDKTLAALDAYRGEFVVQSFDPFIVGDFAKRRPDFIRGQLICKDKHENLSRLADKILAHGLLNFISKPDFINMNVKYLPISRFLAKNRKVLCWTIDDEKSRIKADEYADNYIFEKIRP